jgi:hypothetical protein
MKSTKQFYRVSILLILSLFAFSCSDSNEEPEQHEKMIGHWSRTWFDAEYNANMVQTLTIEATNFFSNIEFEKDGQTYALAAIEGSFAVVDNTLIGHFISFGKANDNLQMEYFNSLDEGFDNNLVEKLTIHQDFVGTWYVDGNTLNLDLDMNDDGSVKKDEGNFEFQKVIENK